MKTVIEFGVRGGAHTDNTTFPTAKLAAEVAARLVMVLTNDTSHPSAKADQWKVSRSKPRTTWTSSTHFVSVSLLDGSSRGSASSTLWKPTP